MLAGPGIPSADIYKFGNSVEQHLAASVIALLTQLQTSIVSELAESENLWAAEHPIIRRRSSGRAERRIVTVAGAQDGR